jgi:hypothetical protein
MTRNTKTGTREKSTRQRGKRHAEKSAGSKKRKQISQLSPDKLNALVSEAIADSNDEEEQLMGLFNMIEENLALPFETSILSLPVVVESVEERDHYIVAICTRGSERQAVCLLDIPLPSPPPPGAEWIEAYRHWARF